ncbi:MAG: response regulator [Nostoc sp. ChiQUE02]|uniref:response regulator n=1 Tax=Nostoc sp. ChiQUE02 TaxID=3075377 RepID=UPI002AD3B134|nr:response regulator [Nostoc sp. ChiQUE02]MDZ8229897.1 response regulator [Nostoc sp. ChiQUE02]
MKILVVEDDELNASALTAVLTNQNYAVEVATDGDAAWDFIQTYDYDLILLDIVLPKLDGISLCRQIRSSGLQMPILLLTGRDSSHEKAIGLDAGADDYVVKPFDQEELIARIRALLRRKGVTSQPVLEYGKLQLDPSSCEVIYAGNLLPLTPKEFALLELFLRNTRRVFSCGMILEHLWSYEDTPQEEAVRTHIKGLRQKLKAVGAASDLVETVYGIGYRLKPLEEEGRGAEEQRGRGAEGQRGRGAEGQRRRGAEGQAKYTVPNLKSQQQTLMAVAEIWQRFQGRVDEQVRVLEEAIATLNQNTLNPELLSHAAKEAHTLAGSLGTFGLPLGSKLARNIELLLSSGQSWSKSEISNLESWVRLLRREIEGNDAGAISGTPTPQVLETVTQSLQHDSHAETKILVVDDDPQIQALLQTLLSPWGLKAIALEDPRQLWESLEAVVPHLLILDVELPYTNGIELCQLVRNDPRWSELPILFLTVHNDAEMVNQVFSVGADDFISKPIVGPELVTRIVNRLERIKLRQRVTQEGREAEGQRSRGAGGAGGAGGENTTSSSSFSVSPNLRAINELELRVAERTAELITLNRQLQSQLDERQRTQEELRFSQARFARILDIADDAIISINGFQCITLFNQGAEKIFGYSAQEVIGKGLDLLLPQRFFQAHRQHVVDFGQSPNVARRMGERREIYGRRKDGTEFPAEASISKIDLGEEIFYTVILRDITERKQIERMKDEFVSVVSHELRTPLTSIHGSLGMLASGLLPTDSEQGKRLLQIATDSSERLVRLINDILDIERIESGKAKMEPEICNIVDLITQAVNVMQPLADKAGVKVSISAVSGQVLADSDRIVQTLTNLLSNAIKFSSAGSKVCLGAQQEKDEVLLTVKDTGRGIPNDKLESIFERFQQVDSSDSRNHDGTGLGLAICKSIMQQHGGRIWAESTLGEGSTFYVTLPLFGTFQNADLEGSSNVPMIHSGYEPSQHSKLSPNPEFLSKGRVTTQEFEQRVMELLQRITLNQQEECSDDNEANSSG